MSSSLNSGSRPWYLPHGVDGVAPFGDPATPVPEQKSPFQPPKTWTLKHGGPILLGEPERKPTMSVSFGPCTFLQVRCYSWAEMDGTRPTPAWPSPLLCHQPAPLRRKNKQTSANQQRKKKKTANTTKMDTRKGHNTTKKKKCPKTANKDYPKKMHRSTKEATPRFFPPPPPPGRKQRAESSLRGAAQLRRLALVALPEALLREMGWSHIQPLWGSQSTTRSSCDIPNTCGALFKCSHHPAALAEPRETLVEPWWNPRETLVEPYLRAAPDHPGAYLR